jgi:hypothetical protein
MEVQMTEPNTPQDKITVGGQVAIAQAIERHRKLGESIAVWRNGKVVALTADQIPPMESPSAPPIGTHH